MSTAGRSEKRRMQSLNSASKSLSLSCSKMASPMHSGKEESPRRSLSHKWKMSWEDGCVKE